jgi:hypothetical protein
MPRTYDDRGSAAKILLATAAYAAVHSLLASRAAKDAAARVAGTRQRNGWYRVAFNAQAVAGFGALAWWGWRLPDRALWRARGATRVALHLVQLGGLALGWRAVRQVGAARMLGLASARAWLAGHADVPPEPEAQGPAPSEHAPDGALVTGDAFATSRHPLNVAPLPVLWAMPVMTTNLAAFNAAATLYLVLGSRHEESRLRRAYGARYEAYRRSGVPFYVPTHRRVDGSARAVRDE